MIRVTWLDEVTYEGPTFDHILDQLCAEPANPDDRQDMLDALVDRTAVLYRIPGGYSSDAAEVFGRLAKAGVILLEGAKGMLTP